MNRGERVQLESLPDLFEGGRVAVLRHEPRDEVIHFVLPACDRHVAIIGEDKAKKQEKCWDLSTRGTEHMKERTKGLSVFSR